MANAVIFGLEGEVLTQNELAFFRDADPFGYILFSRNIRDPNQVRALTSALRELSGNPNLAILVDQEGGRVARLRPPHWRETHPAMRYAAIAERDTTQAERATYLNHFLIACELSKIGINVNCAPVLDLALPGADPIIGDRAFGATATEVTRLARPAIAGLMAAGVMPIVKHIPGHGRATVDSHLSLPIVDCSHAELKRTDFAAFRYLADAPWAMTAHIVYSAIDEKAPATLSSKLINDVIRREIGFDGLLISDDLGMKALQGDFSELAKESLAAGCDIILHCSGKPDEMMSTMKGVVPLTRLAMQRSESAWRLVAAQTKEDMDFTTALQEHDYLFNNQIVT